MTESRDAASALPLAVTSAPDGKLLEAVRALVGRVGGLAGDASHAQPFAAAVQQVVTWVSEHAASIDGDITIVLDREGDGLRGDLGWTGTGEPPAVPSLDTAALPGVDVSCDVSGAAVRCRVTSRSA